MSTTILVLIIAAAFVSGLVIYPFLLPYFKKIWGKVNTEVDEAEEKARKIKQGIEKQIAIAKEKGVDISEEFEDIYQDLEDIVKIIKR